MRLALLFLSRRGRVGRVAETKQVDVVHTTRLVGRGEHTPEASPHLRTRVDVCLEAVEARDGLRICLDERHVEVLGADITVVYSVGEGDLGHCEESTELLVAFLEVIVLSYCSSSPSSTEKRLRMHISTHTLVVLTRPRRYSIPSGDGQRLGQRQLFFQALRNLALEAKEATPANDGQG